MTTLLSPSVPVHERTAAVARVRRAVATAVDRRGVIAPGETVVVACSGGPDSTALLDVLARLGPPRGWRLIVAHVDHGLRDGSAAEAEVVAELASRRGLHFQSLRVSVRPGGSLQERARDARRAALRGLASEAGAGCIALGHTGDDQAETVLMRICMGATPRGVIGMAERSGEVARPLLGSWREETQAYCRAIGVSPIADPSNNDMRFLRSRVRHRVLPELEAVFPGARRRLVTLALRQRDVLEMTANMQNHEKVHAAALDWEKSVQSAW